jgi:protein-tyrosine kinase
MSRLYETLRRMELQRGKTNPVQIASMPPVELVNTAMTEQQQVDLAPVAEVELSQNARLVALSDPRGLAAEKFRALTTRLENYRKEHDLKSLQLSSAVGREGKTLLSGNLAITVAKHTGARVLVVEGDMRRPTLASLFGLDKPTGIGDWWASREDKERIPNYLYRVKGMPLWFLGAGAPHEQPSQILQSARFAEMFARLVSWFDWVVVDSTPILPVVDTNLWSRLVDGTLLVVREKVTPLPALKKALENLDNPKLIGVILNEASEFDRINYTDQYYALDRGQ